MCHCTIRIYNPKSQYHRMKALQRNTRVKWHNPTSELVNIMYNKIRLYRRFKRRFNKDRYDIGAI